MKETSENFIELNREFLKFDHSDKVNEENLLDSYRAYTSFYNTSYSWEELLKKKRVVVLGEAGSGKTWELRERAKQLKQAGLFSVYVRLDQMISSSLEERLDPHESEMFASWKNSSETGYFFLDSVDESKFQKISDFEGALKSFRNAFDTDDSLFERVHVYLSSRISEWLPEMDKSIFTNILCPHSPKANIDKVNADSEDSYIQKTTKREIEILVVTIAPLDKHQVKLFATNSAVNNVDNFIAAIDNSFAWEFTHRPLDVSDLIVYWKDKNKIGSLTELIQNSVTCKLRQRNDRDDYALSQEKAFLGAKWLAAGNVFSRQFLIAICEANSVPHRGLNPTEWLPPDWANNDIRALLNRPIFDSSLYGSVRFHHRRIMEYLAAQWLIDRCEYGCNTDKMRDLLVTQIRGKELIRSSLHPIIAWLCYGTERWSQAVKKWVLELNPTIHLQFGDPSRLSVVDRRSLLVAVSKLASNRDYINLTADHYCISRIASDELSDTIAGMLLDDNLSSDFRVALIKMVVSKRLYGCFNALDLIVFSSKNIHRLKETVLSNLDEIGDKEFALHIYDKLMAGPIMTRTICQTAVCSLYPKFITPGQLVRMFEHSESLARKQSDSAFEIAYYFKNLTATSLTIELLGELNGFLLRHVPSELVKRHTYHVDFIDPDYNWVTGLISITLLSVFENSSLTPDDCKEVALSLCLCGDAVFEAHNHSLTAEDSKKLFRLMSKVDIVRRACFWQLLSRTREQNIDISTILFGHIRILRLTSSDINWIIREAKYPLNNPYLLLAMKAAMCLWKRSGCQFGYFFRLICALSPYPLLRKECLFTMSNYPVNHCREFCRAVIRSQYLQHWWWQHNVWPEIASFFPKLLFAFRTHLQISKIRSGEYIGWLMHFLREADRSTHDFIVTDWSPLLESRGNRITIAVQEGCIATWRNKKPLDPKPNETYWQSIVALTGLYLEYSRNPDFVDSLTEEKVAYATLYALDDLNNFPDWFPKLAHRHPGIVSVILIDTLDDEWKGGTRSVLSKLSRGTYGIENVISKKLLEMLSTSAPADHRMFEYALIFLFKHKTSEIFESLLTLAKQHLTQPNPSLVWLIIYLRLDGNNAITYLESYLPQCSNSAEMMVHICDKLSGENLETTDKMCTPEGYLQTSCLVRFIPLAFQYITPATDLNRSNGSYTPEPRDGAQRYRDVLLQTLATSSDPDTVEYLHQLLENKYLVSYKNWMLVLIDQCRLRQSDLEPWTSKDLLDFASEYNDFEPKNDGELFAITQRQLITLQWDVERSDNSLRNEVCPEADEKTLSLWVSNKLTERSRNRYSVTRETEVDMDKRPDIRICHPRTAPVSIEIKWAENWTLPKLLDQLENQLVGQYLRAYNSRCGIFLLGYIGKKDKKGWVDGLTGEKLNLEDVLLRLKTKANDLLLTNHKIDRLEVIAINFYET